MSAATIALADRRGAKDTLSHMAATRRADALKWAALGPAGANGLCDAGPLGQVPICQRCDDRMERIGGAR